MRTSHGCAPASPPPQRAAVSARGRRLAWDRRGREGAYPNAGTVISSLFSALAPPPRLPSPAVPVLSPSLGEEGAFALSAAQLSRHAGGGAAGAEKKAVNGRRASAAAGFPLAPCRAVPGARLPAT